MTLELRRLSGLRDIERFIIGGVSKGGGFVISTQLERQAPGVKRWPVWPDYDRVLGGLSCAHAGRCCCLAPFAVQV